MNQQYTIVGYKECMFYQMATHYLLSKKPHIHSMPIPREIWPAFIEKLQSKNKQIGKHKTSPLIFCGDQFIGGYDELRKHM